MSIAVLNQVYDEARRLAVAGSVVAQGDFRLKKLVPPLEQAGAKAPVFAKVAECARAVIEGPEASSAESLLELTSLVTAVLYTQGETGCAGELQPIETTDLGGTTAQTSARLLKPLLEALTSTGSGRLELIKDAHQRGAFRDLRLVKPALDGLDDPYPDIAEFLAGEVLPIYGKAILPELRAKYDVKGTKGHPRRLKLMHVLDSAGSRELVKQALDAGSKEVKVAAIACLGAADEDLSYLIEQASAKAQDVRAAAYEALARIDDAAAVAVLGKAIGGKDWMLAARAMTGGGVGKLTTMLVAEVANGVAALAKLKDKKQAGQEANRLAQLIGALPTVEHKTADALTLDLFNRRAELTKIKGENFSGEDLVEAVIQRMAGGPKPLQVALAHAHAELGAGNLDDAFEAARRALPPAEVYDLFAPYLTAGGAGKKDAAAQKREAIIDALGGSNSYWYYYRNDTRQPLDPRWLDLAARLKHVDLIHAIGQPGHPAAEAVLQAEFDRLFKVAKASDELRGVVSAMVHLRHPKATDALLAAYGKTIGKANPYGFWYYHFIGELPKTAIPQLEAIIPKLKDRELDRWVEAIQNLRDKP
jgi:hypothetical protein